MQQYEVATLALTQRANAERLYMHYALVLAVLFAVMGASLIILGLGDHLDILVKASGQFEARFLNASPGVVLWLVSAALFWFSRPRRLRATAHHNGDTERLTSEFAQTVHETEKRLQMLCAHVEGRVEFLLAFIEDNDIDPKTLHFRSHPPRPEKADPTVRPTPSAQSGGIGFEFYQGGDQHPPAKRKDES